MMNLPPQTLDRSDGSFAREHVRQSTSMILDAARNLTGGRAVILGCGRCGEIPVADLLLLFNSVDFVDQDAEALGIIESRFASSEGPANRCSFEQADLTGLIETLAQKSRVIVEDTDDALKCLGHLGDLISDVEPVFWKPRQNTEYQLVVCSSVLTQLQALARKGIEESFLGKFPEHISDLNTNANWRTSIWNFARRIEDAFICHLDSLCSSDGVIYLSDTVHVCFLLHSSPNALTTRGAWLATRSNRLRDYLEPSNEVIAERNWEWIRRGAEGPYWGRLYGIQAIQYRPRRIVLSHLRPAANGSGEH
jgi:hypothetical protein